MTKTLPKWRALPPEEVDRFWRMARRDGECLRWAGTIMWKGYGLFHALGTAIRAHRLSFLLTHGEIQDGLVLDHICNNRWCVEPRHLRAITPRENVMRSAIAPAAINAAKTECPRGHAYDEENTLIRSGSRAGARECRACGRIEAAKYLDKNRDSVNARKRARRAAAKKESVK